MITSAKGSSALGTWEASAFMAALNFDNLLAPRKKKKKDLPLPLNWMPRLYQFPLWDFMQKGGKRAINIWHRRSGKDEVCLHWAAREMWRRPATYWHMLPEYSQ